ncbi:Ion transport protein, partial [Desmophyllum pertusum]
SIFLAVIVLQELTAKHLQGKKDFLMVADVLNVKVIEVKDQVTLFERFIPKIYNSRVSAKLRLYVCHKYFVYFFRPGAATLALIIETSYESLQSSQSVLDFLMVLRVLRLVKIIGPNQTISGHNRNCHADWSSHEHLWCYHICVVLHIRHYGNGAVW